MSLSHRLSLALLVAGLTACPKTEGPAPDAGGQCAVDAECPDATLFYCDTSTHACVPTCRTKDQCTAAVRGQYALAHCNGPLGCQCEEARCVGTLCSSDNECGTQVCRNGACVDAPAPAAVTRCQVTPDYLVARAGSRARFTVATWAGTEPLVVSSGIAWSSANAAVATGSGSGAAQEFTFGAAETSAAVAAVTATVGSATCTAKVTLLPAVVPSGSLDVVVTDELTGRPVAGATVVVSDPSNGEPITSPVTTDPRGYRRLTVAPGAVHVSAFHADFSYLTVAHYDLTRSSPDARFLSLPVRRNQLAQYGGYQGTFTGVPQTSYLHTGLAGLSLGGAITDFSTAQLLGPTVPTDVALDFIDRSWEDLPVPAGTYLGLGEKTFKGRVSALGLAGTCVDDNGQPDEAQIAAGTCGTRTAWAFSADVVQGDLPIDAFQGGLENLNYSSLLTKLQPMVKRLQSSVRRDVKYSLRPTPKSASGNYVLDDVSGFEPVDHPYAGQPGAVPLGFGFAVRSPDLPKLGTAYADGVVVLGAAIVPGRGLVPLGVGAAVNTQPVNARTDVQDDLGSEGLIAVRMAPTHHGLEGAPYGLLTVAVPVKEASLSAGGAASGLFTRLPDNRLVFDPKGTSSVVAISGEYLAYPNGALFNFTDQVQAGLPGRTFRFRAAPGFVDASLLRVLFTDGLDRRWVVHLDPARATGGLRLPKPPEGFADRVFSREGSVERSILAVQALRLSSEPANASAGVLSFEQLVELNDTNADRLTELLTAFSFKLYGRTLVRFVAPADRSTVAAGSEGKLQVVLFRVGTGPDDDGFARVTFTAAGGGAAPGACTPVDVRSDPTSRGELAFSFPAGCKGELRVRAQLYDKEAQPLSPVVFEERQLTLQ